jgi:serine/threonine protein kinase
MSGKSTFGKDPGRLERLFCVGLEKSDADSETVTQASLEQVMEKPGSQIGRFKLLNILGEGGMGIVYLAEQQEPIRRKVALKVIKPGMDSSRVIARFEAERQALALLDHPNIANVYDAGTTEAGRPYFVMEYVKGLSITEHSDHYKLAIEQRLRLFQQVCQAVQHAHQKGIIHRDIKPSNILVSLQDGQAVPKIIDFGVAKAIAQPLTEQKLATMDSQLLGTPEYMSPEQADAANEDIDTRSDIYSLGVLLYVLLTGVLPFESDTLREGGIEHVRKMIREIDPKTPSTRLTKLGDEAGTIAQNRRLEIQTLAKRLRKELEWIPLKAMHKERSERYRSASELADDIENYLKGTPLIAGPPDAVYKLKKFIRRNHMLVSGIAAVILVLVVGIVVSIIFAIKAERARSREQEVSDYLMKSIMDTGRDGALLERTWEDFLENAVKGLEGMFQDQPLVEAKLRYSLAHKHMDASKPETATELLERVYQIRRQHLGPAHKDTTQAVLILGWAHSLAGRHDVAIGMYTDQIEIMREARGDRYWQIEQLIVAIGHMYRRMGKYKEAEACYDEALKLDRRLILALGSSLLIQDEATFTFSRDVMLKLSKPFVQPLS